MRDVAILHNCALNFDALMRCKHVAVTTRVSGRSASCRCARTGQLWVVSWRMMSRCVARTSTAGRRWCNAFEVRDGVHLRLQSCAGYDDARGLRLCRASHRKLRSVRSVDAQDQSPAAIPCAARSAAGARLRVPDHGFRRRRAAEARLRAPVLSARRDDRAGAAARVAAVGGQDDTRGQGLRRMSVAVGGIGCRD